MIHPLADVHPKASIGDGSRIWQFVVVMAGARIGTHCNIGAGCFVEGKAVIGNRVTIKNGVMVGDNMVIEDDVFIGPNVSLTNDTLPRSKTYPERGEFEPTLIRRGSSIGAGAVILPGLVIGENAMVGAGAVVYRDVPAGSTVIGNPARVAHGVVRKLARAL
ncbi:MAG TPA: acyltransferase [Allosphingosinicella sp.]|nr:acyltransferase [Allosphingosinicella sp.]